MTRPGATRSTADDLRAASRLTVEAVERVSRVVEAMHRTIAGGPALLGRPLAAPATLLTGLVYGSLRAVTHAVGEGVDRSLAELAPLLGETTPGPAREAVVAALNGVVGDYLEETQSPLAIEMQLLHRGQPLALEPEALPDAGGKLLVLVHGSAMSVGQWSREGHEHGAALARELGYTPVYVRYNSGLHVSTNGRRLAALLEPLVARWPVPLEELVLLGHSMGGLVARSACHAAEAEGLRWRPRLTRLVTLGTPHHGAPLERGGSWVQLLLGVSRYSAPLAALGRLRGAGITDLRFGNVLDAHWQGRDRFSPSADPRRSVALPKGVECYAVAGTLTARAGGALSSDGLVPVDSALGRHRRPELRLEFPEAHQLIAFGTGHRELLGRAQVSAKLVEWLR